MIHTKYQVFLLIKQRKLYSAKCCLLLQLCVGHLGDKDQQMTLKNRTKYSAIVYMCYQASSEIKITLYKVLSSHIHIP